MTVALPQFRCIVRPQQLVLQDVERLAFVSTNSVCGHLGPCLRSVLELPPFLARLEQSCKSQSVFLRGASNVARVMPD